MASQSGRKFQGIGRQRRSPRQSHRKNHSRHSLADLGEIEELHRRACIRPTASDPNSTTQSPMIAERNIFKNGILFLAALVLPLTALHAEDASKSALPNILIILADDLGYGDAGCYNSQAKAPTPRLDRLAREGMIFTDAHSAATICTPSRSGQNQGRAAWRLYFRVRRHCWRTSANARTTQGGRQHPRHRHQRQRPRNHRGRPHALRLPTRWRAPLARRETRSISFNMLPALLGQADTPIRPCLLQQAFGGARWLSIRRGPWKFLDHTGSGGNNYETPELKSFALKDTAPNAPGQLYDLSKDPGETTNLYFEHPEIVKELKSLLDESKKSGRSRPSLVQRQP